MFIRHDGERAEEVRCARGETTVVPDWVLSDLGYKNGLKDGSILDLTPPKARPAPEPVEDVPVAEDTAGQMAEDATSVVDLGEAVSTAAPVSQPVQPRKPARAPSPAGLQGTSAIKK